jgi:hypothetical protein
VVNAATLPRRTRPALILGVVCAVIVLLDISGSPDTSLTSAQWVVYGFFLSIGVLLLIAVRAIVRVGAACVTTGGSALRAHTFDGNVCTETSGVFGTAIGLSFGPLVARVPVTSLGGWHVFIRSHDGGPAAAASARPDIAQVQGRAPRGPGCPGAVTFVLGLALFVLGLAEAPSLGRGSPMVVGALITFALLAVFLVIERRKSHPIIDVSLFAEPRFLAICAMPILLAFCFVSLLISLPTYFMAVDGMSAWVRRALLVLLTELPLVMPVLISSIADRVEQRLLLVVAMVLLTADAAWLTVIHPGVSGGMDGPLLCVGAGFGVSLAILDGTAVSSASWQCRVALADGAFRVGEDARLPLHRFRSPRSLRPMTPSWTARSLENRSWTLARRERFPTVFRRQVNDSASRPASYRGVESPKAAEREPVRCLADGKTSLHHTIV